jgi:hypothetical protein
MPSKPVPGDAMDDTSHVGAESAAAAAGPWRDGCTSFNPACDDDDGADVLSLIPGPLLTHGSPAAVRGHLRDAPFSTDVTSAIWPLAASTATPSPFHNETPARQPPAHSLSSSPHHGPSPPGDTLMTRAVPEVGTKKESIRSRNVYVAALPMRFGDADLEALLCPYGSLVSRRMFCDTKNAEASGRSYGFALFDCADAAERAVNALTGRVIDGRTIQIRLSKNGVVKKARQFPQRPSPQTALPHHDGEPLSVSGRGVETFLPSLRDGSVSVSGTPTAWGHPVLQHPSSFMGLASAAPSLNTSSLSPGYAAHTPIPPPPSQPVVAPTAAVSSYHTTGPPYYVAPPLNGAPLLPTPISHMVPFAAPPTAPYGGHHHHHHLGMPGVSQMVHPWASMPHPPVAFAGSPFSYAAAEAFAMPPSAAWHHAHAMAVLPHTPLPYPLPPPMAPGPYPTAGITYIYHGPVTGAGRLV